MKENKDFFIVFIICFFIGFFGMLVGMFLTGHLNQKTTYTDGIIVSVNPEENDVTVSIGEGGPRIFVEDLGGYSFEDFSYGDTVEMSFTSGFYHITRVKKEGGN